MTTQITALLDSVFYTGSAVTQDVPYKYPVALSGHPFMLDLDSELLGGQRFRRTSIPVLRTQADQSNVPNEASISPDDMWRRSQDSWHLGAGQTHLDRLQGGSDASRFRTSKGVDVWTKWQLSLLPGTQAALASANNVVMVTAGNHTYLSDGQALKFSTDITAATPSFTTVTGTPAETLTALTTDGYTVYAAYATALYTTTRGAATASASSVTQDFTLLGYVKGRLLGANANVLYNLTTTASNPSALYTHPNTDFTWVGFSAGPSQIYAAGYSGDKSLIYRTSVRSDGVALDTPVVAGELPDGEIVRCIYGYLGFTIIGSDAGVRIAQSNADGSLTIGGLIATGSSVRCLVGYGRFVWFGWTNYDSISTGLGRMDLSAFTSPDTPAYATDLMATTQGIVRSVVMVGGVAVFAVDGHGAYAPTTALVASGTVDSGLIAYDLADRKSAMFVNVTISALPAGATVVTSLSADSGSFSTIGTLSITGAKAPTSDYSAGQVNAETFEIRQTLTRATTTSTGPTLKRHTLRAYPTPSRSFQWILPLLVHDQLNPYGAASYPLNITSEIDFLFNLLNTLVTLQVGTESFQVFVEDIDLVNYQLTADKSAFTGTTIVRLKQPASA